MSAEAEWMAELFRAVDDRQAAIEDAYQHLENAGLINRVVVHRYLCRKRGCVLAVVVRVDGVTIARVRDYKFSPGLNESVSVAAARRKNTLDGERHWPSGTYEVEKVARFSTSDTRAGIDMNCRHRRGTVFAEDILEATAGVRPGHPGKPTLLD